VIKTGSDVTARKKGRDPLGENEKRYRELWDYAPFANHLLDTKGIVVEVNQTEADMLGYTKAEILGKPIFEFILPEQRIGDQERFQQRISGQRVPKVENRIFVRKDGSKIFADIFDVLERDGQGKIIGVRATMVDITGRKQAEEKTKTSEKVFRMTFEHAPDAYFLCDLKGRFFDVNRMAQEMMGYEREELMGKSLLELKIFSGDHLIKFISILAKNALGKTTGPDEFILQRKEGNHIPVEMRTHQVNINNMPMLLGIARDISERQRAQEVLQLSNERYQALFDRSLDCVYIHDFEGNFLDANAAAMNLLGYEKADILRLNFASLMAEDQLPLVGRALEELKETGTQLSSSEFRLRRKDGLYVDVETKASIICRDGRPYAVQGIGRDITERKRAQKQLEESLEKLGRLLNGTIQAMALMVEKRDPYTAGHQKRVSELALAMAAEMALPSDQIEEIGIAAVIHDIGKISIPSEVLCRPGRLEDCELSLLKEHSKIGYEILKEIEFLGPIAQIVYQHHERIDGSGYPQGLAGEEILMGARILGVADVVEAMVSHRPHRPAHTIEKALEEISQNKGIRYDPASVEACIRLFTERSFKFKII